MFERVIIFIITFGIGVFILRYTEPIVRTVGKSSFAEQHLGTGGTYNMWKIIAVVVMVVGFLIMIGSISVGNWDKLQLDQSNLTNPEIITTEPQ